MSINKIFMLGGGGEGEQDIDVDVEDDYSAESDAE